MHKLIVQTGSASQKKHPPDAGKGQNIIFVSEGHRGNTKFC
jgi:hypothetical protein